MGYDNVHLFSFNTREDIVADLNNYKDETHYAEWVNSMILECMSKDEHRLTKDNYEDYLKREYEFLVGYDYEGINK